LRSELENMELETERIVPQEMGGRKTGFLYLEFIPNTESNLLVL